MFISKEVVTAAVLLVSSLSGVNAEAITSNIDGKIPVGYRWVDEVSLHPEINVKNFKEK
jgi:hypothetical protein